MELFVLTKTSDAEMLRLRGAALAALGRTAEAQAALQQTVAVAQAQSTRLWQQRAERDLAHLQEAADRYRSPRPCTGWCSLTASTLALNAASSAPDQFVLPSSARAFRVPDHRGDNMWRLAEQAGGTWLRLSCECVGVDGKACGHGAPAVAFSAPLRARVLPPPS